MKDTFSQIKSSMETWAGTMVGLFSEVKVGDVIMAEPKYNGRLLDIESCETICSDCGQPTESYVEIDGLHYHEDINMCILLNCSKPGFVNYRKISLNVIYENRVNSGVI